ncbi:acyltransferase family protein [Streptomyces gamaensis]|uniref:Acyltransferase family protein n=1 Tax=Streptomyces gamaensis TaxID=1763542 RepID=A0ABW0YXC1_9ACTN
MRAALPTPRRRERHRRRPPVPVPAGGKRHIAPLDGLRGLAVAAVLFFHAGHFAGGFLGVDLFFVLSGFLITSLLLKEAAEHGGRIDLVAFWGRRSRRLLPALAVTVAGTLALAAALGPPHLLRFALDDGPWAVASLANWHFVAEQVGYWNSADTRVFGHLWSIAVEEQFYLLWPLLLAVLVRGRRTARYVPVVAGTGALLSLALMAALVDPADSTRVYEGTDTRAFSLLLGALAASAPVRALVSRAGARLSGALCAVLALGLGGYWCLARQDSPQLFQGGLFAHALAAAALIALLAHAPGTPAGRALGCRPLRSLGSVSYSLYLWHWPLYLVLSEERLGFGGWGRTAVIVGASLAAAVASKLLVEDPVRFRARWATGRTGAAALVATYAALLALCLFVPQPAAGAGTVDITRLAPHTAP